MLLPTALLVIDALLLLAAAVFAYESIRDRESRASKIGLIGVAATLAIAILILLVPALRWPIAVLFGLMGLAVAAVLVPGNPNKRALEGSLGYAVGEIKRFDERDIVFARNRSLPPGSDVYKRYYEMHPEQEEHDAERRAKGGPVGIPGTIDSGHRPNVSMIATTFALPAMLGPHAEPEPASPDEPCRLDPARAAEIVKGFALHLGAAEAGICRVNPSWAYSHRGEIFYNNWDEWGKELPEPLPYAVVISTEMDSDNVGTGPHTPAVVESGVNYAQGAYITTMLAGWFAQMGYKAYADHSRHYYSLIVPLAVDAGLGELGRFGYLITEKAGARARLFAVTTDMPLEPDKPVDLGADDFCKVCKKCALSCPSNSIPQGEKTVHNGVEKWKMNEMTCFDYWGRVGTDCSICMGVCPFSRPNRSVHKLARWVLARSSIARKVMPHLDNFIYGQRWKPREPADWIDHRRK
jgi:reductive dehalogenase